MARLELSTTIRAPIERCFDLARSVDFHTRSLEHTGERAVGGVTQGLLALGDEVTWSGRHFGIRQLLTSRITAIDRPSYFRDSMVRGAFSRFDHDHYFSVQGGATIVRDVFEYDCPCGLAGRVFDYLVLERYMMRLLTERNSRLKEVAESRDEWKAYLG